MDGEERAAAEFTEHRPMLFGLAYRLLGSADDAEDVLQNAYLRWRRVERATVEEPRRYLTSVVTTVAIDLLRQRKARRESYIGSWLPEPVPTTDLTERVERHESVSVALLHLMERLTPVQRAVYVLRTAFDMPYVEIAAAVGRSESSCRQSYRRAVAALGVDGTPRFVADRLRHRELLMAFLAAAEHGALEDLERLLHEDVTVWSDGGGRVRAARRPVRGRSKVARFFAGLYGRPHVPVTVESADLNGAPSAVVTLRGQRHALLLAIVDDRIEGLFFIANPDKLHRLDTVADRSPA